MMRGPNADHRALMDNLDNQITTILGPLIIEGGAEGKASAIIVLCRLLARASLTSSLVSQGTVDEDHARKALEQSLRGVRIEFEERLTKAKQELADAIDEIVQGRA